MKFPFLSIITAAALTGAACGGSDTKSCTPDFNALEKQRIELCRNKFCGDISFKDSECGDTYRRSCGKCKGGETCTPQGICAACSDDLTCWSSYNQGYFCGSDLQCQKHDDYCDNLADCTAMGLGKCENNRCLSNACGGDGQICDSENDEECINGKCIPVIPMTSCSVEESTTGNASSIQAFSHLTAPEAVFTYTSAKENQGIMVTVTPSGIDFDPAIYVLSSISPVTVATGADNLEQVFSDDYAAGKSELVLFTAEKSGQTYYIVVSSDPSKKDGQYKQGRFTICIEDEMSCKASCSSSSE